MCLWPYPGLPAQELPVPVPFTITLWPTLAQGHGESDPSHGGADHTGDPHGEDAHGAGDNIAAEMEEHGTSADHGEAHDGDAHGAGHGEEHHEEGVAHLPTLTGLIQHNLEKSNPAAANTLATFENVIWAAFWMGLLVILIANVTRRLAMVPTSRGQLVVEFLIQGLRDFVHGNLGPLGKDFTPFIGSLFLFIWINNQMGAIPLVKGITGDFHTTLALGLCVFLVVQFHGIKSLGLGGWLAHLAGMPDAPWWMAPINFPLHLIGELVKPISLALRLFGNIFGEHMLVAAFVGLGAAYFLPLNFPFYFLGLLVSFVQAMVFTLLACAYIANMSHHHEEHNEGAHAHDAHAATHVHNLPAVPEGAVAAH
ncbi:MAG TPA: F0F1 ATP synthase subunit A [bacterium]|nr:F0F1 ATP synthase subunit A [bacterium]